MRKEWVVDNINGMAYKDGIVYFINGRISAILIYDCNSDKVSILERFPDEACIKVAFEKMCICNNKIYLFPVYADDIYCYDLDEHKYYKMDILRKYVNKMQSRKVFDIIVDNEYVYGVCLIPNIVVIIDTVKEGFDIFEVPRHIRDEMKELDNVYYPFHVCINNGKLFYPWGDDCIIEFGLAEHEFKVIHLERNDVLGEEGGYSYICGLRYDFNKNLWLCDSKMRLYKVTGSKMENMGGPDELKKYLQNGRCNLMQMLFLENCLYFFLYSERVVLGFDITKNEFEGYDNLLVGDNVDKRKIYLACLTEKKQNEFFLFDEEDKLLYLWNVDKGFIDSSKLRIDFSYICDECSLSEFYLKYVLVLDDLEEYIEILNGKGFQKTQEMRRDSVNCGKAVHGFLK